jgi:signal transduction histidine kinase
MHRRSRWVAVLAALLLIGAVEILSDTAFDAVLPFPYDAILVFGTVVVVLVIAAWFAFRVIDRLTRDLVERHEALESRTAALRAVYDVSLAVSGEADPEQTIGSIVGHARRLLRVDAAILALDAPDGELRMRASSAMPGVLWGVDSAAAPALRPGGNELDGYLQPGFAVRLQAPVARNGARVGILAAATRNRRLFSVADVDTLSALAVQVGLAMEAAHLRDEIKALAVEGERERIAREMHDGLAQVLGYVNTKSQAVDRLLDDGRVDEARRQLLELAAAARSVYVDVREAILSLSTPVPPERGLAHALEEYAAQYAESSKLAVRFKATPEAEKAPLTAGVQSEVFRIVKEALTNIRKHASANRVTITMSRDGDELVVLVGDDGVGFDAESAGSRRESWPHFGLAGMRERAESVCGCIAWRSKPGAGAEVELRVPTGREPWACEPAIVVPSGEQERSAAQHQVVQSSAPTLMGADSTCANSAR